VTARIKEPVNPWPHTIGFALAALGAVIVILRFHADAGAVTVMSVYAFGLMLAFGASALYHWIGGAGKRRNAVFRRIDHAAIFILIASTLTPVYWFGLDFAWRISILASTWFLAIVGITATVWFVGAPRAWTTAAYIAIGSIVIIPSAQLAAGLPHQTSILLLAGSLISIIGGSIYATRSLNFAPGRFGFHEVFHLMVLAGAAVHFAAIAFTLTPPG
jgi:hemolysin III